MWVSPTSDVEDDMSKLRCPHCGQPINSERTWAQTALSSLMAAPAIPDMATQVRCNHCGKVSAASDMRLDAAYKSTKLHLAVWVLGAALVVWAVVELLLR